ncbi:MAG: TetR family transcriptional regulator [Nitriliruptoraceae bacterium]
MHSNAAPQRPPTADDRSTPARIRDAAIRCFAASGVDRTSVRTIAEAAGVSPGLVIHHFGSKDELRVACDRHVAALIREQKSDSMRAGGSLDPMAALRTYGDGSPLLAYLARTLIDGSPHVSELLEELVADAVAYMAEGEANGLLRPTDDPHARAAVLLLWSMGALVLHEQAARLLGVDLLGAPDQLLDYLRPALEVMGQGVMTAHAYDQVAGAMRPDGAAAATPTERTTTPGATPTERTTTPGATPAQEA